MLPGGAFAANSEPISPATAGQAARPEIEAAIQAWAKALGTRDIATISNIRAFTAQEATRWGNIFKNFKAVEVNVRLLSDPEVRDDIATVPVREVHTLTQKNNIKTTTTYENRYQLQKVGDRWLLRPPQ